MPETKDKIYNSLPLIYNYLMRSVNYKDWADYVYAVSKPYLGKNVFALELGAGNCKLANHLSKYYPHIILSDISRNMMLTDDKNLFSKICCNMINLPFNTKFDFIYSAFDSVNYLTSKKKLLNLFKEVNIILSDDGIFTFDVSLERNSLKHQKIKERKGIINDIKFLHKSNYNIKTRIHKNIFTLKTKNSEITEVHKQKIYDFYVYFDLIDKANLYTIDCLDGFTYDEATEESYRAQFIIGKQK